jgi:hypothetical protein
MNEERRKKCGVTTGVKKIIALVRKEEEGEGGREGGKKKMKTKVK